MDVRPVRTGMPAAGLVLLVEPNDEDAERLATLLRQRGLAVCRAASGADAKAIVDGLRPDLVVMELALPDADGLVVCADLRTRGSAPIVVHTVREARERILSLRLGAVDAIAKPAYEEELVTRIEVALSRSGGRSRPSRTAENRAASASTNEAEGAATGARDRYQRMDDVEIDRLLGRVTIAGRALYLSATEYRLLSLFLSRPGDVLTRNELSELLFGCPHVPGSRSIDMHVRRLRAKLAGLTAAVPTLAVARGQGYRLVPRRMGVRHTDSTALTRGLAPAHR